MITAVNGYGGIKLEMVSLGLTVAFDNPAGFCQKVGFRPEGWERTTVNGKCLQKKRFRVVIQGYFENFSDADYLLLEDLITIVNWHMASGEAIRVYPKNNVDSAWSLSFDCRLTGDLAIDDLSEQLLAGQSGELAFESVERLDAIPFHTDSPNPMALATDIGTLISTDDGKAIQII